MNIPSYHEYMQRGTPDFPLDLYIITKGHPKYRMQSHWHKDLEIIHITSGSLKLRLNEEQFTLKKGQCVIVPGGVIHGGEPYACCYECIVFSANILYSTPKCRSIIKTYAQKPFLFVRSELAEDIIQLAEKKPFSYEMEIVGKLHTLYAEAIKNTSPVDVVPNEKLEKIKAAISMISENYGKKILLSDLSSVCGMSPNYFSKLFKDITGQTPFEYIITYRLEASLAMLSDNPDSITDVCYSCGFNDLSYFIHTFKKHIGMTPKDYLKYRSRHRSN